MNYFVVLYEQFFYVSAAAEIVSWKSPFKTEDDAKVLHLELMFLSYELFLRLQMTFELFL